MDGDTVPVPAGTQSKYQTVPRIEEAAIDGVLSKVEQDEAYRG